MEHRMEYGEFKPDTSTSASISAPLADPHPGLTPSSQLVWKKNAPHLYSTLLVFELPWPSLSVQWLPELRRDTRLKAEAADSASFRQRLVLATHTGGQAAEYLRIAELSTPDVPEQSLSEYDAESGTVGTYQPSLAADLCIIQRIEVRGTVERARCMPQNPNIVATVSSTGDAAIWDTTKFPYKPVSHYVPTVSLQGHAGDALAADWSPVVEGMLATSDVAGSILVWDMRAGYDARTSVMEPIRHRRHASNTAVNAVAWHPRRPATLASCGDDGWLYVHQTTSDNAPAIASLQFVGEKPTSLAWNPVNEFLLVVGFDTGRIKLLDVRSSEPVVIFGFDAHNDYVTALHWNTWHPAVLVSASVDGMVKIWNTADFGTKPLFVHGGHKSAVTDVAWNPASPGMLASVSEDNGLHIYRPGDDILGF